MKELVSEKNELLQKIAKLEVFFFFLKIYKFLKSIHFIKNPLNSLETSQ